jgi:hypothetical protein
MGAAKPGESLIILGLKMGGRAKAQVTPALLQLRQIEVQRAAVEKWNGVMPSVVTSGGPVPMLDVFSHSSSAR